MFSTWTAISRKKVDILDLARISDQGDELETLKALRWKIAKTIDASNSGRDIAALSRQMQLVMERIKEIEQQNDDDPIAEILAEAKATPVR